MKINILATLLFAFCCCSCTEDSPSANGNFRKAPRNPNGDSELALLMRDMEEDCIQAKKAIENGDQPKLKVDIERIKTAQATEPDKAESAAFQQMADGYIELARTMELAPAETLESHYKGMVSACMSCHQALCPGPMVRIRKLY